MKKLLVLCLTVLMVLTMALSAVAAPGGFVESPTNEKSPSLVGGKPDSDDCDAYLVVTPYADRAKLNDEKRAAIEDAYAKVVANKDLTKLNSQLAVVASGMGISKEDLAVSELFDVSYYGCDGHENHGGFTITIKAIMLDRFVGLLHVHNGEWKLVENAKVIENNENLTFYVEELSPFAIVVNNDPDYVPGGDTSSGETSSGDESDPDDGPQTGDIRSFWIYIVIMAVSAIAMIALWIKYKKQSAE